MRFVIIATARTGSSHLVNMLGGHPEILCNGNVYHPWNVFVFWPDITARTREELLQLRAADPFALLDRVFATNFGRPHVGFKIFDGQNDEILDRMIDDGAVRKILLYRKNVLANYSSALIARKTGKHGQREGQETATPPKIRFNAQKFVAFHNNYVRFYGRVLARLNGRREKFYLIDYEQINNPPLLSGLVSFIGADPSLTISKEMQHKTQIKQNASDIVSRFSNPTDVQEFLERKGLLHWTHEGEISFSDLEAADELQVEQHD